MPDETPAGQISDSQAAVPAPVIPDAPLPGKVEDVDRLNFLLSTEKIARLNAQLQALQTEANSLAAERAAAQKDQADQLKALGDKYKLVGPDTFNEKTGAITRTKKV